MKITVFGEATSPSIMFRIVVQRCQTQMASLLDPYRPELHYMRGPGPKCREKAGLSVRALR
jgi:hypothetical protein